MADPSPDILSQNLYFNKIPCLSLRSMGVYQRDRIEIGRLEEDEGKLASRMVLRGACEGASECLQGREEELTQGKRQRKGSLTARGRWE